MRRIGSEKEEELGLVIGTISRDSIAHSRSIWANLGEKKEMFRVLEAHLENEYINWTNVHVAFFHWCGFCKWES